MKYSDINFKFPDKKTSECRCILRPVKPSIKVGSRGELLGREYPSLNFGDSVPKEYLDTSYPDDLRNPATYANLIDGHSGEHIPNSLHINAIQASKIAKTYKEQL